MSFSLEDQQKYKALYLQTARQYVKELQDNLHQLNSGNKTEEGIDTLHRAAHSLKGQSEMMGYHVVGSLCALMETIFRSKKEGKLTLTDGIIQKLITASQALGVCVDQIDKNNKEIDMAEYIGSLQSVTIPS